MRIGSVLRDAEGYVYVGDPEGRRAFLTGFAAADGDGVRGLLRALSDPNTAAKVQAQLSAAPDAAEEIAHLPAAMPISDRGLLLGIGLNYREHASDLDASMPEEPASFLKGAHTVIGPGYEIVLPASSERVTAEAELALVIGRECYKVDEEQALHYVAGVCPALDMTAEDILRRNPRFLTRAKNFPTFFSFGPEIVTLDEIEGLGGLNSLEVGTYLNGSVCRASQVSHMRYSPAYLVSFHSHVMPLMPGDIISTGTPGATVIQSGDLVECRIPGVGKLTNPVARDRDTWIPTWMR